MTIPQFSTLEISQQDAIVLLKLNRPQALNALNSQVLADLEQAIAWVAQQSLQTVRGLLLTGAGEKAFVAGADIKEMTSLDEAGGRRFAEQGQKVFRALELLQIPVVAAVNGFALGGGLELALACDFVFASDRAKLGLPEVTLGLIPGFGGTVRLARAVGLNRAKEMVFTGDMITATEALNYGLVNRVCTPEELIPMALKTLQTIATRGPIAVREAKKTIGRTWDQDIDAGLNTEASAFGGLFTSADCKEGTQAFVEKRKAVFQGK